jgi:hypothetical protein
VTDPTLYFKLILRGEGVKKGLLDDDLTAIADAVSSASGLYPGAVKPALITYAFTIEFAMFGLGEANRTEANELSIVTALSQSLGVRGDTIIIDYYCAFSVRAAGAMVRTVCDCM